MTSTVKAADLPEGSVVADDRTVLLTLNLPLNLRLVAELARGIEEGAERAGHTDVAWLTDGSNRIVARRKPEPRGDDA